MVLILLACAGSLAGTACSRKVAHAAPPVAAPPAPDAERPMNIAPDTDAAPPAESVTPPPAIPVVPAAVPPPVAFPQSKPAPAPRKPVAEQQNTEGSSETPHAQPPQISPQLSPGDQATYERRTNDDINVAEKNLQQTGGKQLSAAQQDLVGKIRSFLDQSRDASKGGDWARAQTLAQKARLLSVELVNSL